MAAAKAGRGAKVTLLLASTLTVLAAAIVAPALPAIEEAFAGVPHAALLVRLLLVLPALFIVLGSPLAGLVADRVGRKPVLLVGTLLYAVAGSSGLWLDSLHLILVGRALLGVAVACVITAATTMIADVTTGPSRRRLLGLQAAAIGLAGAASFSAGGFLAGMEWRMPFALYLAAVLLVAPMVRTLREPAPPPSGDPEPPLPVRLLAPSWAMCFVAQVIFYLAPLHLPFHFRDIGDPGEGATGLALALITLSYAAGAVAGPPLTERMQRRTLFAGAFGLLGCAYLWIALQRSWAGVLPGLVVSGISLGLLVPALLAKVAEDAPEAVRGRAVGSAATFLFLGQFMAPILSAPLVEAAGYRAMFGAAGALGLAAALPLLRLPARRHA